MTIATQQYAGTFVAEPNHSSFRFSVEYMRVSTFRGGFSDVDARLIATDSRLALEGRARVESISIADPPELRAHVVNSEDFFDAGNHPEIGFRTDNVELAEDGTARAEGELEIKGIARPVTATGTHRPPVADPFGSVRAAIELTATVDRREWGMNWQMPMPDRADSLAYEVDVTVHLHLVPAEMIEREAAGQA